jgi:hypothetical protein
MPKAPDPTRDEVLKRLLSTPPKPFTPKAKGKASPKPAKPRTNRHQGR